MTETLRWTWRLRTVRIYIVTLAIVASLSGFNGAFTVPSAVAQSLTVGRTATILLGPMVLALLWGAITDSSAEETAFLAGQSIPRQRLRTTVAGGSVLVVGIAVASVAALPALLFHVARTSRQVIAADVSWDRTLVHLVLTVIATVAVSTALLAGRSTMFALLLASCVLLLQVLAVYSADLPGGLVWKVAWPGTAAMVVSESGENYTRANAAFAAASIAVWCAVATDRLVSGRRGRTSGRAPQLGRSTAPTPRLTPRRCALGVAVLAVLAAGLPSAARSAPIQVRPSLVLQRLDGTAPEQVVREFFDALSRGDEAAAARFVTSERGDEYVRGLPGLLRAPSYGPRFELAQVDGLHSAQVNAYIAAGEVLVTLVRDDGRWQIVNLEPVG